jgi:hypothetical protein
VLLWVIIFGAIALAGLVVLICYAVWLAHKTADVMSELRVLADRSGRILDLLGQIEMPHQAPSLDGHHYPDDARILDDRDGDLVWSQNRARDVR